jgi:FMN phosphatase YigB (HAD superfamily)
MMRIHRKEFFNRLPDVILCDIDNTLYDYSHAHENALKCVMHKIASMFSMGVHVCLEHYEKARMDVKNRLYGTASSHSRLLYFQSMFESMHLGTQVLFSLECETMYWRVFLNHAVLFEGVEEWLDDMRMMGIPVVAVTDMQAHIQCKKMVYWNIDSFFDHMVTSEECGADKPDSRIFKRALEKLQLPKNPCVWMVGDDILKDMEGSKEVLGAVAVQKRHEGVVEGIAAKTPDACFDCFEDLRRWFLSQREKHGRFQAKAQ